MIDGDKLIDLMVGTRLRDDEWPIVRDIARDLVIENDHIQSAVEERDAEIRKLRLALEPFAHYAKIMMPEIDFSCGHGFYAALQKARTALEEN